jgi:MFS superfamily sulfate permease-like transporter
MFAHGIANAAAGLFQGVGLTGLFGESTVSAGAGGRTGLASIALGILLILTLLFLAPLFSHLPQPVLAAVITVTVIFGLLKVGAMRRLWRLSRTEFWLATAALLGVLTFGILQGVLIGVGLSLLWLVWRASHPAIPVLGRMPDSRVYHSLDRFPDSEVHPGLLILRFDGPLFFATAPHLRDRIRALIPGADPEVRGIILDLEGTNIIDLEGSDALHNVVKELGAAGIDFHLVRIKEGVLETLEKDGVLETLGPERLFDYVHEAVEAARSQTIDRNNKEGER